ncbi:MAG: response regulator [Bacteroidota bacterium]
MGQELLDLLRSTDAGNFPDIILLDLNMPGKNGFETLTEIRSDPGLKHLNVIMFSTSNSERDKNTARERGANNYIVKPSELNQLIETFKKIVG